MKNEKKENRLGQIIDVGLKAKLLDNRIGTIVVLVFAFIWIGLISTVFFL